MSPGKVKRKIMKRPWLDGIEVKTERQTIDFVLNLPSLDSLSGSLIQWTFSPQTMEGQPNFQPPAPLFTFLFLEVIHCSANISAALGRQENLTTRLFHNSCQLQSATRPS